MIVTIEEDSLPAWIRIVLTAAELQEFASDLIEEFGFSGAEFTAETEGAFFKRYCEISQLQEDLQALDKMPLQIVQVVLVEENDWVTRSGDDWETFRIANYSIVPVLDEESGSTPDEYTICLRPGMGFGTGHHPTTAMLVEFLSDIPTGSAHQVLDVGTGSGILGLAARRILSDEPHRKGLLLGIDIDFDALLNADGNRVLNDLTPTDFSLVQSELEAVSASFDVVIANLYSELLKGLSSELFQRTAPGGSLLVSGVLEDQMEEVQKALESRGFSLTELKQRDGWCAFLFEKLE